MAAEPPAPAMGFHELSRHLVGIPDGAVPLERLRHRQPEHLGTLFSCSLAGFALAQLQFRAGGLLFLVVLCTILLPYQVRMVPIFIEMATLGWIDSFKPLIVPAFF